MKKLLLLLCLSLPAFGQIINPTSGLPSNYSVVDANTLSGPTLTITGTAYLNDPINGPGVANSSSGTTNTLCGEYVVNGGVQQIQTGATTNTSTPCWPVVKQRNTSTNAINGCTSACTTGNAYVISTTGQSAAIQLDNTCTGVSATGTLGHLVIRSTSAAGQYHDSGATAISSIASGTWVAGRCVTSGSGTQTVVLEPQVAGGAGGTTILNYADDTGLLITSPCTAPCLFNSGSTMKLTIPAGTMSSTSKVEAWVFGHTTNGDSASKNFTQGFQLFDGTHTVNVATTGPVTVGAGVGPVAWSGHLFVKCRGSSVATMHGVFSANSTATAGLVTGDSAASLGLTQTFDCTQQVTIVAIDNTSLATTTVAATTEAEQITATVVP